MVEHTSHIWRHATTNGSNGACIDMCCCDSSVHEECSYPRCTWAQPHCHLGPPRSETFLLLVSTLSLNSGLYWTYRHQRSFLWRPLINAKSSLTTTLTVFLYGTVTRHLTTQIRSEECAVMWFCHCENIRECTYTNLDDIAYCTSGL